MSETISCKPNGKTVNMNADGERALLLVLYTDLGMRGKKYGCRKAHYQDYTDRHRTNERR